jgi:hypothetical protein
MALPQLSEEQRAQALAKAAEMRQKRARLKEDLKSGEKTLADVFKNAEDVVVARMKVSALLESLPGFGKAKAAKLMSELGISETRRVKGLGVRQRTELLERLGAN